MAGTFGCAAIPGSSLAGSTATTAKTIRPEWLSKNGIWTSSRVETHTAADDRLPGEHFGPATWCCSDIQRRDTPTCSPSLLLPLRPQGDARQRQRLHQFESGSARRSLPRRLRRRLHLEKPGHLQSRRRFRLPITNCHHTRAMSDCGIALVQPPHLRPRHKPPHQRAAILPRPRQRRPTVVDDREQMGVGCWTECHPSRRQRRPDPHQQVLVVLLAMLARVATAHLHITAWRSELTCNATWLQL